MLKHTGFIVFNGIFLLFLVSDYGGNPTWLGVGDGFYIVWGLFGDSWSRGIVGYLWVYDKCLIIWPFLFLLRIPKNGSSLKLCSMVNLMLICWFCCHLRKLLILHHENFQNMKRSSKYFFHDLINSAFRLYFFRIISYRFSSWYCSSHRSISSRKSMPTKRFSHTVTN